MISLLLAAHLARAGDLSFSDAVRAAADASPAGRVAAAEATVARGEARAFAAWPNPDLSARHEPDQDAVELSIPLDVGAIARGASVSDAVTAADVRARAARAAVGAAGGGAWLDARRAEDRAVLARDTDTLAERLATLAQARVSAGEWSADDAVLVQADAARLLDRALTWRQEAVNARERLAALLALSNGDLSLAAWPEIPRPPALDATQLPAVLAADLDARIAFARLRAESLGRIPVLRLDGGLILRGATGPTYGASITLPLFAPGVSVVDAARGRSEAASASAETARLDAVATVRATEAELATAEQLARAWDFPGVADAVAATTRRFEAGELSLPDYVARRDLAATAAENAIDARWRLARARLAGWELAGQLPPEASP